MKKVGTALIATLILTGIFIAPAMAMGPKKSKGNKVINVANYYIIVSNRGWRQWRTDMDRFAVCLFTDGMSQEAIDSHLAEGWNGPWTMLETDPRFEHVSPYTDGDVEIIWKYHDIPTE